MFPDVQLEHEINWETVYVSLDCLNQSTGRDAVKTCEVRVQEYFLSANQKDA